MKMVGGEWQRRFDLELSDPLIMQPVPLAFSKCAEFGIHASLFYPITAPDTPDTLYLHRKAGLQRGVKPSYDLVLSTL